MFRRVYKTCSAGFWSLYGCRIFAMCLQNHSRCRPLWCPSSLFNPLGVWDRAPVPQGMESCRLCLVSQDLTKHCGEKWLKIPNSAAGLSQEVGKRQGTCLTQQGEHRETWLVVVIQKQYEEISCSPVPKIIMTLFLFPQLGYLQACSITCVV